MWKKATVSVVLPAYNEEEGISASVRAFASTGIPDEVIVVDNNSRDATAALAAQAGARVVPQPVQGYGAALAKGLQEATGDIVVMCEPDGSFAADDIEKLLLYCDDFDVVFGTRTSKTMIWSGAKMDSFLRYGNAAVAKLLEYLHNGPCLTDVGCTFKAIKRPALTRVLDKIDVRDSRFSPHFMILCIRSGLRCIEIPVNYKVRVGQSKITSTFSKSFKLGMRMIGMIVGARFRRV
jgi:glycosyltransferase involved in cell wall biosynthesis